MTTPQLRSTRLWNKNFVLWWLGSAQSAFGTALASIATSFLVLHQTGSAGAMGLNLALGLLPALLQPFMGAVVDRLPLKPPLILGNLLRGLLQISVGLLALRGEVPLTHIYLASFLTGLIGAFYMPATQGMVARLVPAEHLERATGLIQGSSQLMTMLGYAGGGVLVASLGRAQACWTALASCSLRHCSFWSSFQPALQERPARQSGKHFAKGYSTSGDALCWSVCQRYPFCSMPHLPQLKCYCQEKCWLWGQVNGDSVCFLAFCWAVWQREACWQPRWGRS